MPTAFFNFPTTPGGIFTEPGFFTIGANVVKRGFVLAAGPPEHLEAGPRVEHTLNLGISPSTNESWEVKSVAVSGLFFYLFNYYHPINIGLKELEEAKTARTKALSFAEKAVTSAKEAETAAKAVVVFAEAVLAEKAGNENKQKLEEAFVSLRIAQQALENAKVAEEEKREELKMVERELTQLGWKEAIEGAVAREPLTVALELGQPGEPFLVQDLTLHRGVQLGSELKVTASGKAVEIPNCSATDKVDERLGLDEAVRLGERDTLKLTLVFNGEDLTNNYSGPKIIEDVSFGAGAYVLCLLTRAIVEYKSIGLSDLRREPQGPRPGR